MEVSFRIAIDPVIVFSEMFKLLDVDIDNTFCSHLFRTPVQGKLAVRGELQSQVLWECRVDVRI